jgi:hypothetical protein
MDSSLTLLLTSFMVLGSLVLGTTIGWIANDVFAIYLQAQQPQVQMHPEMYDDDGIMIREELYSVRFTAADEEEYYDDED